PELHRLDPTRIEEHFARLHELSFEKMALETHAILHMWAGRQRSRLLAATGTRLNGAGAELRRRLMLRGRRASRIREVIHGGRDVEGGDPLFDLHPVWMTSPETAAQIFPLEPLFDLVIFDEASQCRLEEGVPVLCRGKGVVVAGDTKQLPPTRFFESAVVGSRQEDADEVGSEEGLFQSQQSEVEDLLGAALNIEIEQSYLDVHYRSTSEELIAFSNEAFYGARLQAIPGHPNNRPNEPSIRLHHAGGIYEERRNPIEAAAIVELVRDYLRRENPPSIGIATFNLDQRDLIEEELDRVAEEDPAFRMVLAAARERVGQGSFEGLFVKNLENVQGDERDVMMIGTTYGPNAEGRFYRRFGPLGRAGGERRLNVLVTRARLRVHVVTSIPPEVYRAEAQRATPAGMRANGALYLMRYLVQAERVADYYGDTKRAAPEPEDAVAPPPPHVLVHHTGAPSAFVEHLAELLLRNHGIPSMLYYGNDGFCVDLAFRHPARPDEVTVGVVVDATRYRRAEDRVEWDDFRRTVLGAQRWDLHRIWTPHFVRDPEGTVARLVAAARSYEQEPVPE
ncbi:MAG: DNA helicase, partial [Candidatus Sumerlaeia bacterium]|nr:DNA helicase [Candidatus Sumerlaeia bacterium]